MILTSGFNFPYGQKGNPLRVAANWLEVMKAEIKTWLIKFTSVSFDNSESEACWVHGTNDGRQGVPWQGSAS